MEINLQIYHEEGAMKEIIENMIKNIKRIDGIPSPEALREVSDCYNEQYRENQLHDLFESHKKCIENYMLSAARDGKYDCWSEPLSTTFSDYEFPVLIEERREYLKNKIKTVFEDALGFKVSYIPADDVMVISWEKQ